MMEQRVVFLLCLGIWGVTGKVDHAELRGEHSNQEDIDNGQCEPMPCVMGVPPQECKRLCDSRNYETICQPPVDFCLCRHMVDGKMKLVSPDEVNVQPPDSSELDDHSGHSVANEEPSKVIDQPLEPSKVDQPQEKSEDEDEGVVSFQIFAVFLPIKRFLYESLSEGDSTSEPSADPSLSPLGYETINVHEGRLFWDFRYILTGLLLLMIGLVVYELVMCAIQVYGKKSERSVQYEDPDVKIMPVSLENEKILNH